MHRALQRCCDTDKGVLIRHNLQSVQSWSNSGGGGLLLAFSTRVDDQNIFAKIFIFSSKLCNIQIFSQKFCNIHIFFRKFYIIQICFRKFRIIKIKKKTRIIHIFAKGENLEFCVSLRGGKFAKIVTRTVSSQLQAQHVGVFKSCSAEYYNQDRWRLAQFLNYKKTAILWVRYFKVEQH